MIYLIKLKNGSEFEVSQSARDQISNLLTGPKENRPEFIELENVGAVISTSSIAVIVKHRQERPAYPPTEDEELAEFNRRWDRDHARAAQ